MFFQTNFLVSMSLIFAKSSISTHLVKSVPTNKYLLFHVALGKGPTISNLIEQMSKGWIGGQGLLLVDVYLVQIFGTNHTSLHTHALLFAYLATNSLE